MSLSDNTSDAPAQPGPAVEALLGTLRQELDAMHRLSEALTAQLDALRRRQPPLLEQATDTASEAVGALGRLQQARERQTRLLGRVLGRSETSLTAVIEALDARHASEADALRTAHDELQRQVHATYERAREIEFALGFAARLGQELLQAWQHLEAPATARVYTASGHETHATPARPFVNRLG